MIRIPAVRKVDVSELDADISEFVDYIMGLVKDEPFDIQVMIKNDATQLATAWNLKLKNND